MAGGLLYSDNCQYFNHTILWLVEIINMHKQFLHMACTCFILHEPLWLADTGTMSHLLALQPCLFLLSFHWSSRQTSVGILGAKSHGLCGVVMMSLGVQHGVVNLVVGGFYMCVCMCVCACVVSCTDVGCFRHFSQSRPSLLWPKTVHLSPIQCMMLAPSSPLLRVYFVVIFLCYVDMYMYLASWQLHVYTVQAAGTLKRDSSHAIILACVSGVVACMVASRMTPLSGFLASERVLCPIRQGRI